MCTPATAFKPRSKVELKGAVNQCLRPSTVTRAAFDIGEARLFVENLYKDAPKTERFPMPLLLQLFNYAGSGATKVVVAQLSQHGKDAPQIKQILLQDMEDTHLRYHMRETDNVIPTDVLVRKKVLAGVRLSPATPVILASSSALGHAIILSFSIV